MGDVRSTYNGEVVHEKLNALGEVVDNIATLHQHCLSAAVNADEETGQKPGAVHTMAEHMQKLGEIVKAASELHSELVDAVKHYEEKVAEANDDSDIRKLMEQ